MKQLLLFSILAIFIAACSDKQVTSKKDYNAYLENTTAIDEQVSEVDKEIIFWSARLQRDTGNFVDMMELAHQYSYRFKLTGSINDLIKADSFMLRSSEKLAHTNPDILYTRSQTAITMHRFRDAYQYNSLAAEKGGAQYTSNLLSFDAGMELGLYKQSYKKLDQLRDKQAIDYMIRKSKEEDHKGNLDVAIGLIEKVLEKAEAMEHTMLVNWSRSTLGDMYGHAGRVKDAYQTYLRVLANDPGNMYAMKGIAWLVYSHDRDTREAGRIIDYIHSQTILPDLYLLQAEMAEYNGDHHLKNYYQQQFLKEANVPGYGDMYNKYLIQVYAEDPRHVDKALQLASKELQNRNTPETNDWYAWALFQKGAVEQAYRIAAEKVYQQTSEPEALMHTAYIFAAMGKKEVAEKLFTECLESSLELGPVATASIRKELKKL